MEEIYKKFEIDFQKEFIKVFELLGDYRPNVVITYDKYSRPNRNDKLIDIFIISVKKGGRTFSKEYII